MASLRRFLVPLTFAALALTAASCGVDAGDQASSTATSTTEPSSTATFTPGDPSTTKPDTTEPDTTTPQDLTPEQEAAIESMTETYKAMGLSDEDSACLAEGMAGLIGEGTSPTSSPDVMDIINDCNISMDTLNQLGESAGGDGTLEDGMRFGLETSLKQAGLTDEQASCMADAYIEEYGTDASAATDPAKLQPLMAGCDVKPSDLRGN